MPAPLQQIIEWPGVVGVESLTYTCSHGISPGTAVLVTNPQEIATILPGGTLLYSDGNQSIPVPNCRVDRVAGHTDSSGTAWTLIIQDRRWQWQYGCIFGRYNQIDNRGKLVPWTIRSPVELATLCFQAMGETGYTISGLPDGLTAAAGQNVNRYLLAGENFPQTLSNPPVVWDGLPPAQALAQLCDRYGCRVIYNPTTDAVSIFPLGTGGPLPVGPCEVIAPAVKLPATPSGIGVLGAPIRYQLRLILEPVGRDWDDSYRPVQYLSYAPTLTKTGDPQISQVTFSGSSTAVQLLIQIIINIGYAQREYPELCDLIRAHNAATGGNLPR